MRILFTFLIVTLVSFADVGTISALRGSVHVKRSDSVLKLHIGDKIFKKDSILTGKNAKAQLILKDHTVVTIGKNSVFEIDEYFFKQNDKTSKAKLRFKKGFFKTITGKIGKVARKNFKIKTHNATIGIRGTQIMSMVDPKAGIEFIACTKGAIDVISDISNRTVRINANELVSLSSKHGLSTVHKLSKTIRKALNRGFSSTKNKKTTPKSQTQSTQKNSDTKSKEEKASTTIRQKNETPKTEKSPETSTAISVPTQNTQTSTSTDVTLLNDTSQNLSAEEILSSSNDLSTLVDSVVNDITQDVILQTQESVTDINLNFGVSFGTDTSNAIDPFK